MKSLKEPKYTPGKNKRKGKVSSDASANASKMREEGRKEKGVCGQEIEKGRQ